MLGNVVALYAPNDGAVAKKMSELFGGSLFLLYFCKHRKAIKKIMTLKTILLGLLLCPLTAVGQRLEAVSAEVDAGRTGYCMPVTATFQIENKGSRHLTIKKVLTDCGCTRVDYPRKSIAAGETFTVSLTYDARMLGHFVKQAAVFASGEKAPLRLTMKGVVLRDWQDFTKIYPFRYGQLLTDMDVIEFDDVNKGDRPQQDIHLFNNSNHAMTPNLLHLPTYLQAEVIPHELPAGSDGIIRVTLNTGHVHAYGLTQTSVYMAQQLGEKVSQETEVPVSVVLLPDMSDYAGANRDQAPALSLSTDSIRLGIVDGKLRKKGTITVTNTGMGVLDISSLQLFTGGMRVTLDKRQLKPQERAKLTVTIDRRKLLAAKSRPRVLMITNDPERSKVVIKINVK